MNDFQGQITHFLYQDGIYLIRLILSALLGVAIGWERSRRQKEAGIRTHVLVAMGSALVMIISKYGFSDLMQNSEFFRVDPSRVAANIITGVSFLGAGVIFVKNTSIRGLTTAAGIWTTSALGMALGAGMYGIGIAGGILMIVVQLFLHNFFNRLEGAVLNECKIKIRYSEGVIERLKKQLADHQITIEYFHVKKNKENILECAFSLRMPREMNYDELNFLIDDNPDIVEMDI